MGGNIEGIAYASIPIPLLTQNSSGVNGCYPLDFSVLGGLTTISITWNNQNFFIMGINVVARAVDIAAFNSAPYITCQTSDLRDGAFSVKQAMNLNPMLVYSIPAKYINSVVY